MYAHSSTQFNSVPSCLPECVSPLLSCLFSFKRHLCVKMQSHNDCISLLSITHLQLWIHMKRVYRRIDKCFMIHLLIHMRIHHGNAEVDLMMAESAA